MTERRSIPKLDHWPLESERPRQDFFVLRETPCPYLPGKLERKLVTELSGADAPETYSVLSRAGFRRSHLFAYKPACRECDACIPVRVVVRGYAPSKSLRRVARRNRDLTAEIVPPTATSEQYQLFSHYLARRHGEGEMAGMSFCDYRSMVEETAVATRLAEFRDSRQRLRGVCLLDLTDDGASAVYSFFDPAENSRSLGTFMIHWLIAETARRGLPYVYLGYWIAGAPKMAYKVRFSPLEALGAEGWQPLR